MSSDKTKKPTPKRLDDARKKGQVAKSQEVGTLVELLTVFLWLWIEGDKLQAAFVQLITLSISGINLSFEQAAKMQLQALKEVVIQFVFGLGIIVLIPLVLSGMMQVGLMVTPDAIIPSPDRINPLSQLKQMFSAANFFKFVMILVKVSLLTLVFYYLLKHYAFSFAHLSQANINAGLALCLLFAKWIWGILLIASAVFAVTDYIIQRHEHQKELMMSERDIKQEHKDMEGSPEIKRRRIEMHREIQSGSLSEKIAQSSMVLRNPTHLAVCLRYVPDETPLPVVLDYGRGERALWIIKLAEKQNIPIVEQVALARALVAMTQPGDYIPEELFRDVAQVLRMVQQETEKEEDANPDEGNSDHA